MNNYIKVTITKASTMLDWTRNDMGLIDKGRLTLSHELWFFDDSDPQAVSAAIQKSNAYRDRHLGARLQVSCWRRCVGLDRMVEVGEPSPCMRRAA